MNHTPRFGIQTAPQYITWQELKDIWQAADDYGLQTAFTFDHFLPISPGGSMGERWVEDSCLEGWSCLTALGALTKQINIGCLVTGNTYRHPALLANMAVTVDHITNGRLIMGIGAAWYEREHRQYGIPFFTAAGRIRRLGESVQIMRSLWTKHRTTFDGKYYQLTDALCEPKPIRQPHPPILIGGGGEKLTLRVVAENANIWHGWGDPGLFQRKLAVLREHCAAVGRDINEIEVATGAVLVMDPDAKKTEQQVEAFAASRKVSVEQAKRLAFAGTPDEVAARVQEFLEVGVTHFIFSGKTPPSALRVFAEEVMPRFRPAA